MEDLTSTIPNSYNNNWKIPMVEEYSFEDDTKKDNVLSNINSVDDLNADNIEQYVAEVVNNGDCFNDSTNLKKYKRDIITPKAVANVYDVVVNGNRTSKADEHDCFSDIEKIEYNGEIYTNAHEEDIMNRDFYKKGETVIYNRFGSKFLFDFFSSDNPNCDPYGIKLGEWK